MTMTTNAADARRRARLRVTNSEMGTFRSCREKWWLAYHELLRPKRTARPLAVGRAMHAGAGHVYRHLLACQTGRVKDAPTADLLRDIAVDRMEEDLATYLKELWDALRTASDADTVDRIVTESEEASREARSAVVRFVDRFAMHDYEQYKIVAVEQPFHVPLVDAGGYRRQCIVDSGVWDLVMFDPSIGDFILNEHKSTSGDAHAAERKLDMDPQTTGYVYALREALRRIGPRRSQLPPHEALAWALRHATGRTLTRAARDRRPKVGRVFYNVIRKQAPKEPSVNEDGTVSTAAVDTLPEIYEAALDAQAERLAATGGDPAFLVKARAARAAKVTKTTTERLERNIAKWQKIQDKQRLRLESLPGHERYSVRIEVYHGADLIERWRKETLADATLIRRALRGDFPITRNPQHCNPQGSFHCAYRSVCIEDSPELREAEYKKADDPHTEVVEAEAEAAEGEL